MEKIAEKIAETEKLHTNFYTYEGVVKALNGVTLEVKRGETYGLVGESGCGKSVTVRSLMRIVQSPGKIEEGKIFLFFNDEDKTKAVDIVKRSESYMQTIRGNDVSMIFQEASTSLNPVLSIEYQVGESFRLHRLEGLLQEAIDQLNKDLLEYVNPVSSWWKRVQINLLSRQMKARIAYVKKLEENESIIMAVEEKGSPNALQKKKELEKKIKRIRKNDGLVAFIRHIPFLRRYYKIVDRLIRIKVVELLEALGIPNPENVAGSYPHELSGGMQQRIVIAIALACQPRLLIADEPTSNLDVTIQAQILDLIHKLKETQISSVLFITHDLGVVAEICDRVTVMYAGDVCETADVQTLFNKPLHPYTKALLKSVPKIEQDEALATIPGIVPNLVHPPSGCRFHPRCEHAMDICKSRKPETIEKGENHTVACHLYTSEETKK